MRTDAFDYELPEELIAQQPLPDRDASRLMIVDRASGTISHRRFSDLPELLRPDDCLVVNTSRVIPARLTGVKVPTGGAVEILLLENREGDTWSAMTRGAHLKSGSELRLEGGRLEARVIEGPTDGVATVVLSAAGADVRAALEACGHVPLPPYIKREIPDPERYQTVYCEREISAAAPTAGLHFTEALLAEVRKAGVEIAGLELAVGMDTFVPVREENVEDHRIHTEWFSLDEKCTLAVNGARARGGRAIAVGTTTVRVLETCAELESAPRGSCTTVEFSVEARHGYTDLFITPSYEFRIVDALITNFHFPRSTLLMLVCAFGGTELVLSAYREAVRERYRFYSFGDAMLLL